MAECTTYNSADEGPGGKDGYCPSEWPVYEFDLSVPKTLTIVSTDPRLASELPYADLTAWTPAASTQKVLYRIREHYQDRSVAELEGTRTDNGTFVFDVTSDYVSVPGLYLVDVVLYGDDIPRWVHRGFMEVEPNSLNTTYNFPVSIAELRLVLRDECPEGNFLLDDYEYTNKEIWSALRRCVDYWNEQPPPVGCYNYNNFPWRHHWILGAIGLLMRQAGRHKLRNHLDYSGGGVSVGDQGRWQAYHALGDQYWDEFKEWVIHKKIEINMAGAFMSTG